MKAEDIISKYVKFREGGFVPQENPYDRFKYNTSDNTRVNKKYEAKSFFDGVSIEELDRFQKNSAFLKNADLATVKRYYDASKIAAKQAPTTVKKETRSPQILKRDIEAVEKMQTTPLNLGDLPLVMLNNPIGSIGQILEGVGFEDNIFGNLESERESIMRNRYNPYQSFSNRFNNTLGMAGEFGTGAGLNLAITAAMMPNASAGRILGESLLPFGSVDDLARGAGKIGDYLTTQTPLKDAYKLNPSARATFANIGEQPHWLKGFQEEWNPTTLSQFEEMQQFLNKADKEWMKAVFDSKDANPKLTSLYKKRDVEYYKKSTGDFYSQKTINNVEKQIDKILGIDKTPLKSYVNKLGSGSYGDVYELNSKQALKKWKQPEQTPIDIEDMLFKQRNLPKDLRERTIVPQKGEFSGTDRIEIMPKIDNIKNMYNLKSTTPEQMKKVLDEVKELNKQGIFVDISNADNVVINPTTGKAIYLDLNTSQNIISSDKYSKELKPLIEEFKLQTNTPKQLPGSGVDDVVDLYRVQEKNAKTFQQLADEGKLHKAFNNPETLARKAEEEKYFGQWFTNDKKDLDFYKADREFLDPEIIHLRVPKSELSKYSNYDKSLSRAPDREFVIPLAEQQKYMNTSVDDVGKNLTPIQLISNSEIPASTIDQLRFSMIRPSRKSKKSIFKKTEEIEEGGFKIKTNYRGNEEIPNQITVKGNSGYWQLRPNKSAGDNTWYFSANMDSQLESGKAMLKINEKFPFPKPSILEPNNLSLDSYNNLLNMGKRKDWTMQFENYVPLNYSSKHNTILKEFNLPNTPETSVFNSKLEANQALEKVNEFLGKKGVKEKAKIYSAGDSFGIEIPNFKLTRKYSEGGRVPIYVDSKNDPRYKAYNDSLSAYNYGQTLPNLWESSDLQYFNQEFANNRGTVRRDTLNRGDRLEYPTQRTTNGTSRINAWENSYRNINPIAIGRSSLYLNNRLVNPSNIPAIVEYPIYPKPQQPVKLKPKETERMLEATLPEVTVTPPVDYSKSGLHYSIGVDKGKVIYRVGSVGNMKVLTPAQFEEFKKTPDFQMYNEVRKNDTPNVEQYLTNPNNAYRKMENGGEIKLDKEKLSMMMQKIFGK